MHSTINAYELWKIAHQLKVDRMKHVCVSIGEDGSLNFSAIKSENDYEVIVYDPIDAIDDNPLL